MSELVDAVVAGDEAEARSLLAAGASPDQDVDEDNTLVGHATWKQRVGIVQALLDAGADPGAALIDAAYEQHAELTRVLLAGGADIDRAPFGTTAMIAAAEKGALEVMALLIAHGADLKPVDEFEGRDALSYAIMAQAPEAVRMLVEAGAPLEQRNSNGYTPLLGAVCRPSVEIVNLLLQGGADPSALTAAGEGALELAQTAEMRARIAELGLPAPVFIDDAFRARFEDVQTPAECLEPSGAAEPMARIAAWMGAHRDRTFQGAADPALAELETTLGRRLPTALRDALGVADGNVAMAEYEWCSTKDIAQNWQIGKKLFDEGTFDTSKPHQRTGGKTHTVWWHPALISVAQDGGGNQICIDLDPASAGTPGQLVWWEIRGGPVMHPCANLEQMLRVYAGRLASLDPADFDDLDAGTLLRP